MPRAARESQRWILKGCLGGVLGIFGLLVLATTLAFFQGRRTPEGPHEYVALGSSFAAGAGLGKLQKDSPLLCARTVKGYPQQLARLRHLSITDMSCGGAVTSNLLRGGQFFQGPQIQTIGAQTRLVTITVGGNDIGYIGDLSLSAARKTDTVLGWSVRRHWKGPKARSERDYTGLKRELLATLRTIHRRAPRATIVIATYPALLPPAGTCARIGLTKAEADEMREVGNQLSATTRSAAEQGGAILVDMHALGAAHDACSSSPWTNGWSGSKGAPFHPSQLGAEATARAISDAMGAKD